MVFVPVNPPLVPIKLREMRRFDAADPWRDDCWTGWTLTLYRMVPRNFAVSASWKVARQAPAARGRPGDPGPQGRDLARDESVGLETEDGQYRLLPRALFDRWRDGGLDAVWLPSMLNRLEPRLKRIDFRPLPSRALFWVFAAPHAALILALLGVAQGTIRLQGIGPSDRPVFEVFALLALGMILVLAWLFHAPRLRYRKLTRLLEEVRP